MDLVRIAVVVDMAIYALVGFAIVWFGKRRLPFPWNKPAFTVPIVLSIGAIITLASLPHWFVFPQ